MLEYIKRFLEYIGEDPSREGLIDTPKRVVKSWAELYAGYDQDPAKILSTCFVDGACDEVVILRDIEFSSMCEHHILPFVGRVDIGYIPNGKVIGLSKLARLVECFAKRLQIQEKMTGQISQAIQDNLQPKGVAVVIRAHHQCMSCRGIKKANSLMITSSMVGVFRDDHLARAEFMNLLSL